MSLDDAAYYLDASAVLPGFRQVDPCDEGFRNEDLGLGPSFSEVRCYVSEQPFELVWLYMFVASGEFEKAAARAELRDQEAQEEAILASLRGGMAPEEAQWMEVAIEWSVPPLADTASMAQVTMDVYGEASQAEFLMFIQEEGSEAAVVVVSTLWFSDEVAPSGAFAVAREVSDRIAGR